MRITECGGITTDGSGRELAGHGGALFPVAAYYTDISRREICWHWHDDLEVIYAESGSAKIFTAGTEHALLAGDCIFINAGALHGAQSAEDGCVIKSLVFHPRLIGDADSVVWQKYIRPLISDGLSPYAVFRGGAGDAPNYFTKAWDGFCGAQYGYEFEVRENLSKLVLLIGAKRPRTAHPAPQGAVIARERVKAMINYIELHYAEELSLADIAASAAVSKNECLRCFNRAIGCTPIQFLTQLRIQLAAAMLEQTGKKVSDIAFECGFKETSYFTKTFKRYKGSTPGEYRARCATVKG